MNDADRARFRRGDPVLFRKLVDEHTPRLLSIAQAHLDDPDAAHDVVQESWIRAFERRGQFTGQGSLLGWLAAITRRQALSSLRRPSVRDRVPMSPHTDLSGGSVPDAVLENESLRKDLLKAVLELPERQRDTVLLRIVEGKTTAESARVLGCAEGTVKAALHAAVKKLAPKMKNWAP